MEILPKHMGILFAQVVISQNIKIKDIAIFAMNFCKSVSLMKLSQISEIGTGKNFQLDRENMGNLWIGFEWGPNWPHVERTSLLLVTACHAQPNNQS